MASIYEILSYENIATVCDQIVKEHLKVVSYVIIGTKSLAVVFIALNWIKNYFESLKDPDKPGLSTYNILTGILYLALVVNISWGVDMLDKGLGAYQQSFQTEEVKSVYTSIFADWMNDIEQAAESENAVSNTSTAILGTLQDIFGFIGDPWQWIIEILKPIAYFINLIALPLFLLERGFLLMLMKIAMPLVLALGAIEMYRPMVKKWLLLYCGIFISGLFLILATQFCDMFYQIVAQNFNLKNETGYLLLVVFIVAVFAKVRLYKAAVTISYKIFNA